MKIYDCFQFFDEEMLLELRLNILDKYVDKFVISEASYMHNGKPKKLNFDINKFSKFKEKIVYIEVNNPPPNLSMIGDNESQQSKLSKKISNAYKRHIYQLDKVKDGITNAEPNDIIIIGDLDEIPNLEQINFNNIKNKLIFFEQKMFYYKLNLFYKKMPWFGSKACKKKYFKSPQWIQWIKNKKYPIWRIDILFSQKKYNDIYFVKNGGWHFTNIRKAEDLEKKMLSFVHYPDFEDSGLKLSDLKKIMNEKKVMYDHSLDKKNYRWSGGEKLITVDPKELPEYIFSNLENYKQWLDI